MHPVDDAFHLQSAGVVSAFTLRHVGAMQGRDVTLRVLLERFALHDVGAFQARHQTRTESEILLLRHFHEIVAFDVELTTEGQLAQPGVRILGVDFAGECFRFAFRVVGDDELDRIGHHHGAGGVSVEVLAHAVLEQAHVDHVLAARHADELAEVADRFRRITTTA